ncbi:Hypothetical protein LUCI_0396 [Lucifera butyrica]|uniref:Uncharacterized protein n=1 Tax=Lucifera butyrica TaxID=1351585 RepID=A0A498R203_9FIRM|nr:hypothetical protein [Lucifera butyrica]VBB05189.1 Hypothetical protein LUCI_0396 [Lucifera butyrica]
MRPDENRFLLLKARGAGFWFDMEHVVGGLLIAEMAGRIPIVYWGKNSIYGGSDEVNAFEQFFLPVSAYSVRNLMRPDYRVCPAMWNPDNLITEETSRFITAWWYPMEEMLARTEEVMVLGWAPVHLVQSWLQQPHPACGTGPEGIYRYIFSKYITLQPSLAGEMDAFYDAYMQKRHILAVHVRASDKVTEIADLHRINQLYYPAIERYLAQNPDTFIFLLTESETILAEYRNVFKERLIYTHCRRTRGEIPIYDPDRTKAIRMGAEVLKDTYLALRCNAFFGNSHSNVSNAVVRLKKWPAGSVKLFSVNDL